MKNEAKPESIFQVAPVGIGLVSNRIIVDVNHRVCEITGYSKDELIGNNSRILYPSDEHYEYVGSEKYRQIVQQGTGTVETQLLCKNGRIIDVLMSSTPLDQSDLSAGVVFAVTDITDRKRAQNALSQSENLYRTLFNSIDEGFCIVEMILDENEKPFDYRFLEVNPAFENQTGLKNAAGKSMRELVPHQEPLYSEVFGRIAMTGESARFQNPAGGLGRFFDVYAFRIGEPEQRRVAILFDDIHERKEAEEALLESEARYRSLFHDNHAVMLLIDPADGRILDANKAACEYYGYAIEAITGLEITDINTMPPDQVRFEMELAKTEKRRHFIFKHRMADGRFRDVEVFSGPIFIHGRKILYSIIHDITERKRAEAKLIEAEQKYRELVRLAPAGIYEIDFRTRKFTTVNDAMCHMTGYSREELLNIEPLDILDEEGKARFQARISKWLGEEEPERNTEYKVRKKDGRFMYADLNVTFTRDENGNPLGATAIAQDITLRKQEEARISRYNSISSGINQIFEQVIRDVSEDELGNTCIAVALKVTGSAIGFLCEIDTDGQLHDLAISGCRSHSGVGHRHIPSDFLVHGLFGRILETRMGFFTNDPSAHPDNIGLPHGYPLIDSFLGVPLVSKGKTVGILAVANRSGGYDKEQQEDLVALAPAVVEALLRKRAEDALKGLNETLEQQVAERTDLAESRARLLQSLAVELVEAEERERQRIAEWLHDDLQQVLAGARLQVQAAGQKRPFHPTLEKVDQLLQEAIDKSRRMSHRLGPPILHQFGLIPALEWMIRQMSDRFGLQVDVQMKRVAFKETTLKIFLFRAVQELLFNVVKHSGVKRARLILNAEKNNFMITVSDQGHGFDPDILKSSIKEAGLGLLSLRERARALGGRLEVQSGPGKGSRFTLTIPAVLETIVKKIDAEAKLTTGATETIMDPDAAGIRVFFVDDHKVMRQGLIGLIEGQPDITVVGEAADGHEAVDLVRQIVPNVVVMDISMPKMDGIEATRRIKAEMPEVHVIGLSMFDDREAARKMRQAGAEEFVSKSESSGELLKAIYKVAGRPQGNISFN